MAVPILEGYRLSAQQEDLWSLQLPTEACRSQMAITIDGPCTVEQLFVALQQIAARHEILRTAFHSLGSAELTIQRPRDSPVVVPRSIDVSADASFYAALHEPFDLERGEVLHATVIPMSATRHVVIVRAPALCADAQSMKNLFVELAELLGRPRGEAATPAAVTQYADYAQWQCEMVASADAREGVSYWANAQVPPNSLRLPYEPKLSRSGDRIESVMQEMDLDCARGVQELARCEGVDPETVMLSCWQLLLLRLSGRDYIRVDVRMDGRELEALQQAIGCFSRFIPIGLNLAEDLDFSSLLKINQRALATTRRWQAHFRRAPAERAADPHVIGFAWEELPADRSAGPLTLAVSRLHHCSVRAKLQLTCVANGGRLTLELRHDPSSYASCHVAQLATYLTQLVASVVEDPGRKASRFALLDVEARRRQIEEWNQTARALPAGDSICELIARQVARAPDAVAVRFEQTALTYHEFDARSSRLAHRLAAVGVGPGSVVALYLERSVEMICALLAILRAGAAYVPMDVSLPGARLEILIEDSGATCVVTQQSLAASITRPGLRVLQIDADDGLNGFDDEAQLPAAYPPPDSLAYVIFTSGSSGRPKGVAVEHAQLLSYVHGIVELLGTTALRSYATVSTIGSDLGNTAIFPALCTGAELHVISQECASDAHALAAYFSRHSVDCLKITPSHLSSLLAAAHDPADVLPRKCLVSGGESLTWGTVRVIESHAPHCRILNHFGPTETTIGACVHDTCDTPESERTGNVPIGFPLPNVRVYLLDPHLEPVPPGVPGEIYIGGGGVARGYVGRQDAAADRFFADPFAPSARGRLYRSGDLGRRLPSGAIEFLGRSDRQVKIRGHRVEPGEIESALCDGAGVRVARVVVAGEAANRQLIAYVVPNAGRLLDTVGLADTLRERLPDYMLPARIVLLARLPLTANGKVDERALPAPDHVSSERARPMVPARTATEQKLSRIFMSLLGIESVGVHDDFFEIGGHSLLATRLLSVLREEFKVAISLRTIFESPTIEGLGLGIDRMLGVNSRFDAVAQQATGAHVSQAQL